jgi:hypothetical protein
LRAASTLFTPKCAFDEKYRKFGPGLILEYKVIEAFYADESFDTMNAATTVDGHVISDFWNGERTMGTLIVGPTGWRTRLLAQIESAHHDARKFAKSLLRRFRCGLSPKGSGSGIPPPACCKPTCWVLAQ